MVVNKYRSAIISNNNTKKYIKIIKINNLIYMMHMVFWWPRAYCAPCAAGVIVEGYGIGVLGVLCVGYCRLQ